MEIEIKDNEIIIDGIEIKPYWIRLVLALFPWTNPRIILKNPKLFYRKKDGELVELNRMFEAKEFSKGGKE